MASREIEKNRRKEKHSLQRKRPHLVASPTILIVCEGENTEISYFNQLKLRSATIQAIGEGYNTVSLVERAEKIYERLDHFSPAKEESSTTVFMLMKHLKEFSRY